MTDKEIAAALRYCGEDKPCGTCSVQLSENEYVCIGMLFMRAAEAIEQLTAQKEKAEAEAAVLLKYAATMQECETCKHDSFCHLREPMQDDCSSCARAAACPCQSRAESGCWEWRGLPEAPEKGEKT